MTDTRKKILGTALLLWFITILLPWWMQLLIVAGMVFYILLAEDQEPKQS